MTERERLIEILSEHTLPYGAARMADDLLANGVIVPPCKAGDKVYYLYWFKGEKVGSGTVEEIYYNGDGFAYHICHEYNYFDLQHEEAYFTKEEAEKALKERTNND